MFVSRTSFVRHNKVVVLVVIQGRVVDLYVGVVLLVNMVIKRRNCVRVRRICVHIRVKVQFKVVVCADGMRVKNDTSQLHVRGIDIAHGSCTCQ